MGEVVLMAQGFTRVDGALWCEGVPLSVIAERVGTPSYVYSAAAIRERYAAFTASLTGLKTRLHYSVKANSNLAVLNVLQRMGAGVDIVSGGELYRAVAAGFSSNDIVFSGVGKTADELAYALRGGVKMINVESPGELHVLNDVARKLGVVAPVALRVNPDVSVDTPHPYTRTGEHGMKFGIPDDQVVELARESLQLESIQLVGLAAHIGSQISQPDPYAVMARQLLQLYDAIRALGITTIRYIDIGGGLAVTYQDERPVDLDAFAQSIASVMNGYDLEVILEPGRYLVADAGVLLARVVYRKHSGGKEIVITDTGMNDLIRPSLYDAYHAIDSIAAHDSTVVANVVGPICESGDFFAMHRKIDNVQPGDILAIRSAGAYGFVMSSNYNTRPRAAEVLVDGDRFAVVRQRETYEDLVRLEQTTPTWEQP
jgi:diaminopimelate decarboxylase